MNHGEHHVIPEQIRSARLLLAIIAIVSIGLYWVRGYQHSFHHPYAGLEMITFVIANTGNFALSVLERKRKLASL